MDHTPSKGNLQKRLVRHACVGLVAFLLLLVAIGLPSIRTVKANSGCPSSTSILGDITLPGTCTVDTPTTWENGSITIAGNIDVNAPLTLNDVFIYFDTTSNDQYELRVNADLAMSGGGAWSLGGHRWKMSAALNPQVVINGSEFAHGEYDFTASEHDIGYSVFRDRTLVGRQHIWIGANSNFHHNTLLNINLAGRAAIVIFENYGNSRIWANELHLNCYGSNCMGIETRHMQEEQTNVYPGFPVVEVAWNNITWEDIGSGDWAITLDNEYSARLYLHNNTQYNSDASVSVGACLQGGGARRGSIYENNTCYGSTVFGIWDYIYSDTGNVFQYNYFQAVEYGGLWQIGNADIRHNEFRNVSRHGIEICQDGPCGGTSETPRNLRFYNNTFTFTGTATLMKSYENNYWQNTVIHHGNGQASQWKEDWTSAPPAEFHTVPGVANWLYHAQDSIERLLFANESDGDRRVTMTANGGNDYWSTYDNFGATDDASLSVEGAIDPKGSLNDNDNQQGTFLWQLGPSLTSIDVLATGIVTFTVDSYFADTQYNVSMDGSLVTTFITDAGGRGSFSLDFASQHTVAIDGVGPPPLPDGTAPATVTDLDADSVDSDYAILQWTAPGDDGNLGQASSYDLRYSTTGPLDEATFLSATPVPIGLPAPGPSGTTESVNVTGLSPGTQYWFALRSADEVPNWSPVSNNVNVTTSPLPDVSSPAQVTDLEAVAVNSDYVVLQWRAPGDDGDVGQADAYDVRYSTTGPLDEVSFGSATPVPVSLPAPIAAGGIERLNVTGLAPATNYWFALRTTDEVPNWSPVSNGVNATTLPNATDVDSTPPTVQITSPDQDELISGTVPVIVEASDDTGVEEVMILLNGILAATLSEAPYLWAWSTASASLGWHTLQARAADLAGNIGESAKVGVVVLPPGLIPESLPPTVDSVRYDPAEGRIDIRFSRPMDRDSFEQALSIEPEIVHQTAWEDDSNVAVTLQEGAQPDVMYTLTIAASAADVNGTALGEAFIFGFRGGDASMDSGVVADLWLRVSLLLTVGLVGVVGLHLWSRRGVQRVRLKMRQLARRLEDLDSASQARIYRELADLEGLLSESATATESRPTLLSRPR